MKHSSRSSVKEKAEEVVEKAESRARRKAEVREQGVCRGCRG